MRVSGFFKLFFAGVALALVTGCSHMVPAVPSASAISSGPKIQADVGLILSDDLKRFSVAESRMGDTWNFANLGQASAEHFRAYLESRFRRVTLVAENSTPASWSAQGLSAVIDPRVQGFTFDIPILKMQTYPATIRYSLSVYAPGSRQTVYKGNISGVGDTAGSPGFDFAANPSKSASRAVEEGVKASVEDMLANPGVKALLAKPGATGSAKDL
jgi:hypothetical protein